MIENSTDVYSSNPSEFKACVFSFKVLIKRSRFLRLGHEIEKVPVLKYSTDNETFEWKLTHCFDVLNYQKKNDFLAAVRTRRGLTTADIGIDGTSKAIFINDHLTPHNKTLFKQVRKLESWLNDSFYDSEYFDRRYETFRCDRDMAASGCSRGGGLVIAVRSELFPTARLEWCAPPPADELWVSIPLRGRCNHSVATCRSYDVIPSYLHLACVYVPHGTRHESQLNSFYDRTVEIINSNSNDIFILLGDYNISSADWVPDTEYGGMTIWPSDNSLVSLTSDFMNLSFLQQYNHIINYNNRLLDLVFCSVRCCINMVNMPLVNSRLRKLVASTFGNYVAFSNEKIKENPKFFWPYVKSKKVSGDLPQSMVYNDSVLTKGKLLEKIVSDQLSYFIRHRLSTMQHGFVNSRSVDTNMITFTEFVLQAMDQGKQVDAVYSDFSKAFDKISHNLLLQKLWTLGVHGNLLRWLESYIRNRSQAVCVKGYCSAFLSIPSGVPQGSHLGPYADDTKLYKVIQRGLQSDLDSLTKYCRDNKLFLNADKCRIISFSRKLSTITYPYKINNMELVRVDSIRDLGIIVDSKLSFKAHYDQIVKRAFRTLGFIIRISKPFNNPHTLKILFFSFVRSILEFGSVIWNPFYKQDIARLEKVQFKFMKLEKCNILKNLKVISLKYTVLVNTVPGVYQCFAKMDQEIIELRSVLRSLVVSSPTQVDVRSLLRDYRNMMGSPIPLAKYGYRDPLLFLRERCGDCFLLTGPATNPILTLIVPDTLKHIDQFVQRQKLSSTVKHKGKRRSVPGVLSAKPQSNLIADTFKPNVTKNNRVNREPVRTKEPTSYSSATEQTSLKTPASKILPISKSLANVNISDKENKQKNSALTSGKPEHEYCSSALEKFLKKRLPAYSETSLTGNDHSCENEQTSLKDDGDSGRQTSSSNSSSKAARLEELKTEIKDLIADHPEGVPCTDLIRLYRERYGRELDFSRFGYTSILSVVMALDGDVAVSRAPDSGEWVVRDPAAPAPAPAPACAPAPRLRARAPAARPPPVIDPEDALPGIDFDPDVFPADCMHFMDSIPAASLAELEAGAMLEVVVGEVYSPSHFWLLRLGPDHYQRMEDIMDEMTSVPLAYIREWSFLDAPLNRLSKRRKYYTWGAGRDRWLPAGALRVGHYCSSVFEGDWHRSLIVRVLDSETVKVRRTHFAADSGTDDRLPRQEPRASSISTENRIIGHSGALSQILEYFKYNGRGRRRFTIYRVRHVDYGTVETVRAAALKPLLREWGAPGAGAGAGAGGAGAGAGAAAQAVRARLAGVRPPAGGRRWPHSANHHFLNLVRDKRLYANVVGVDREVSFSFVFLPPISSYIL
ncbi:unnamed protein product [Diatraea saccharalis]|uniref:HTH OST-type domain-containing protein n=1 Tax=Diatraea saccharalis TaxID=40085 RepID=A0A9N9WKN0_9NEOP|nr:unnamed protein product [Diatraea saccharalis]